MGPEKERIMMFIHNRLSTFLCASLTINCVSNCLACAPSGMGGPPLDKKLQDAVNKFDRRVIRDLQQVIHSPKQQLAEMFV